MLRSFARTLASLGIFLLFPLFVQAQASCFSVGTATAAPGQKSTGYLEVPAGVDAATNIPVIVINGEKRGRVLAFVSGAHGTEYTSIIAIEKLINLLDPSQILGTVILVPLVNIQSFEYKVPHVNSKCFQETLGPSRLPSGSTEWWMSCPTALAFGTHL